MPESDYIATTDIKLGREADGGHEIVNFDEGDVVERQYFTDDQWDHLIEIGTLVPQAVSKQAVKLEEEVEALKAKLAEVNRQLASAQAGTLDTTQGPDPAHAGAGLTGPEASPVDPDAKVATPADLQKATEGNTPADKVADKTTPSKTTSATPKK